MYKIITAIVVIGSVAYIAMFFYQPEQTPSETVREQVQEILVDPLEESRKELERATTRLAQEESRILGEMHQATSSAENAIIEITMRAEREIEEIEAVRDEVVSDYEEQLSRIHALKTSF